MPTMKLVASMTKRLTACHTITPRLFHRLFLAFITMALPKLHAALPRPTV